ncbi:hypothetical protein AB6A40_001531 [Gnathostoma spinigerum]|uniref:Integrator complex subunit 6 n=1 Tax=Gnathostoma spinigerum TaxID=75299 RepID=A0ABD6EDP2_9BILA
MTIVLFLVDTSASMAQRTYQGTTLLDVARSVVELFLKQRSRDASARGDRYMLMSFEEFPKNVKSGWREGQAIFHEQLKSLKAHGLTTFGNALGSAFRFVNVNRMQTGIDNYGWGRYPYYLEPVVIISITDGNSLTCPLTGKVDEIKFAKPTAIGNELTEEPFRWDQRLFSVVLRLPGSPPKTQISPGMHILPDRSPIDCMCVATGGRSYCITSHRMIPICVDSIVQKMQQIGVLVKFDHVGAEPTLVITDRMNGNIENEKLNGDLMGSVTPRSIPVDDAWKSVTTSLYSRASRAYPGHWPIPEAFWPDCSMNSLPPRKAHPVITFRCEPSEPLVCQEFPFDKYELEPSPLTQLILDRKQTNVCWQVFVKNSDKSGGLGSPFGYLKAATNLLAVNLFIMPYNYPVLLPLIDELRQDPKARTSQSWRLRLEKYLSSIPTYYLQPLRKAFSRMNVTNPMMEQDQIPQYSYSITSNLTKMKHVARQEFDSQSATIASALQHSLPLLITQMVVPHQTLPVLRRDSRKESKRPNTAKFFKGYQVHIGEPKARPAPSSQFRNPFEITRNKLIEQLTKMRANLEQHLRGSSIPVLEGGLPGTNIKLQHAEDLHCLPINQMGNYQEYIRSLEAIGRGPLREVEPQAIRAHAFGNPFKIDKKNMTVDEVNEGNLLTSMDKIDSNKKRGANLTGVAVSLPAPEGNTHRPPRRKPGPLAADSISQWRRRRREWSLSSSASSISSLSDIGSVSSLDDDLRSMGSNGHSHSEPSTSSSCFNEKRLLANGSIVDRLSGSVALLTTEDKRNSRRSPPAKKQRLQEVNHRLSEGKLDEAKIAIGSCVRRNVIPDKAVSMIISVIESMAIEDQQLCLRYGLREARRFKRKRVVDSILQRLKSSNLNCNNYRI